MSQATSAAHSIDDEKSYPPRTDVEQPPVELDEKPFETQSATPPSEPVNPFHPSQFPDGGKDAWLCLLGGFCCLFCSFGWINCLGVFQNYYQANQLRDYSPSSIAWIASIEIFMMFFPGPIVGWAFDNYGPKYLLVFGKRFSFHHLNKPALTSIGTFFHIFGLMMTSLCTEYYQFILAQAICSPLGLNCIFNAATSTIPTWFLKKRGAAYGIMAAGSGLGGIIIPIMASHLIPEIGFGWTMRTIAFMLFGLLCVATLTVKSRLPPRPRPFQLKVFLEPFNDTRFVLLTASSFLFFMGLFIPINFIEVQAIADGMSVRLASYLLAVLNAARYVHPLFSPTSSLYTYTPQYLWPHNPRRARRQSRKIQHAIPVVHRRRHNRTGARSPRLQQRRLHHLRRALRLRIRRLRLTAARPNGPDLRSPPAWCACWRHVCVCFVRRADRKSDSWRDCDT